MARLEASQLLQSQLRTVEKTISLLYQAREELFYQVHRSNEEYELTSKDYSGPQKDKPEVTLGDTDKHEFAKVDNSGHALAWDEHDPATGGLWGWGIHGPPKWIDYATGAKERGLAKAASSSTGRSPVPNSPSE